MSSDQTSPLKYCVAVVGAGPAGIYAARYLAEQGMYVVLFNRDIKPGGLAEYGIYYDKYKMKAGLRRQFYQILDHSGIDYRGYTTIGQEGDLSLDDLRAIGFQAILVTVGAQGTKWLGLPGEELTGVYHAKDLVYHYNKLPPYSAQKFDIGQRVALVGVGNVMLDIAHWLVRDLKVDEIVAIARRGPAEVKFSKKEMEIVARNLDLNALSAEIERVRPVMEAVGQDVEAAHDFILSALSKALPPVSDTRFRLDFLASPSRILGDEDGRVCGLVVENTTLTPRNGDTKAKSLGTTRVLDVDTVVFCIGDRVDETFGLPVKWNEFIKNPAPNYPVNGLSYEAFDPQKAESIDGIFVAGWSREASSGLVGVARKDGENGARAVTQYLEEQKAPCEDVSTVQERLESALQQVGHPIVAKQDVARLVEYEEQEIKKQGLEDYKLVTNAEMLEVMDFKAE